MNLLRRRGWELPERLVTPEHVFFNRRAFLAGGVGAAALVMAGRARAETDPSASLYPATLNPAFKDAGREVTPLEINATYNNYYEFGTSKQISALAETLPIRPWSVVIDGEVEKPVTIAIDDLLKQMTFITFVPILDKSGFWKLALCVESTVATNMDLTRTMHMGGTYIVF